MNAARPPLIMVEAAFGDPSIEVLAAETLGVRAESVQADSAEQFFEMTREADGVIVQFLQIDAQMLAASRWRVVGRYGIGVDNVDVTAATESGIAVINVPDYCLEEVAEHAAALIYGGWRRLRQANDLVVNNQWADWKALGPIGRMSTSTLGIVGMGRIGRELHRLLAPAFGEILVHDPEISQGPAGTRLTSLDELLATSDAVSLHCPLTDATRGILGWGNLPTMKTGTVLVNVSRGELIDQDALIAALDRGSPGIAMLDVLAEEPPAPTSTLVHHPRAFVTPHVAWLSSDSVPELRSKVAERVAAYLVGMPVPSVVNASGLKQAR